MSRVLQNVKIIKMGVDKVIARFPYHTSKEYNIFKNTPQHTLEENMVYLTRLFPFHYFETPLKVEQHQKPYRCNILKTNRYHVVYDIKVHKTDIFLFKGLPYFLYGFKITRKDEILVIFTIKQFTATIRIWFGYKSFCQCNPSVTIPQE